MCRRRLERSAGRCWGRFRMFNHRGHRETQSWGFPWPDILRVPLCPLWCMVFLLSLCTVLGCGRHHDPNTLVMIIESSPTNLDPRIGTDAQSERIDQLIFDSLVHRDEHFNIQPWVAERWEVPDLRTYVFHLRQGIRFHDGRPLTARDVKWTLDSIREGSLIS